jgi:hypothetical protein
MLPNRPRQAARPQCESSGRCVIAGEHRLLVLAFQDWNSFASASFEAVLGHTRARTLLLRGLRSWLLPMRCAKRWPRCERGLFVTAPGLSITAQCQVVLEAQVDLLQGQAGGRARRIDEVFDVV